MDHAMQFSHFALGSEGHSAPRYFAEDLLINNTV
jgi:hypothetical protein